MNLAGSRLANPMHKRDLRPETGGAPGSESSEPYEKELRVDAALLDGERNAIDRQHIGGDAVVDVVGFGVTDHILEAVAQDGFKLLVDDGFFPEVALAILHPLEVAGRHAA